MKYVIEHPDGRVWIRHSQIEAARVIHAIPRIDQLVGTLRVTRSNEPLSYAEYGRWSRRGRYPTLPPHDARHTTMADKQ